MDGSTADRRAVRSLALWSDLTAILPAPLASGSAAKYASLNHDLLDLIERDGIARAVVELCRARRFMGRHHLGVFHLNEPASPAPAGAAERSGSMSPREIIHPASWSLKSDNPVNVCVFRPRLPVATSDFMGMMSCGFRALRKWIPPRVRNSVGLTINIALRGNLEV
jgi:hypothetical protein